jgi:hypothetical protein
LRRPPADTLHTGKGLQQRCILELVEPLDRERAVDDVLSQVLQIGHLGPRETC